jgi:hypothetical protein
MISVRAQRCLNPLIQPRNGTLQILNVRQQLAEQDSVVRRETACQSLGEAASLPPKGAFRQLR